MKLGGVAVKASVPKVSATGHDPVGGTGALIQIANRVMPAGSSRLGGGIRYSDDKD
jgi:hypothetical protein